MLIAKAIISLVAIDVILIIINEDGVLSVFLAGIIIVRLISVASSRGNSVSRARHVGQGRCINRLSVSIWFLQSIGMGDTLLWFHDYWIEPMKQTC